MKHYTNPRIQKAQLFILKMSQYLEIICAMVLIAAILIAFLTIPGNLYNLYLDNGFELSDFIRKSFDLVIGVELLKMFCRHDIDSVVEVLLFAVARQIVIEHMPVQETLIGVASIAILFAIRRFLFVSALDDPTKIEEKIEKDEYIHQKIAEAVARYKKEAASTSMRDYAQNSIHTKDVEFDFGDKKHLGDNKTGPE